jgi:hypothetical protein
MRAATLFPNSWNCRRSHRCMPISLLLPSNTARATISILSDLNADSYRQLLCRAILGEHAAENVILMEIDPLEQKTVPDFLLTKELCGVETVNARDLKKEGKRLYY